MIRKLGLFLVAMSASVALLSGCSNSNNSSSGVATGSLEFAPGTPASVVVNAGPYDVTLDLVGSSGVVGQVVTFSIADTSVASIYRPRNAQCVLSSGSIGSSECTIQIVANAVGSTTLTASSPGYASQTRSITTTPAGTVNFGQLAVRNGLSDGSQFVTTSPVTLNYAAGGTELEITSKILGSSGVSSNTSISFTTPSGVTAVPTSCQVTSETPVCKTKITGLPATAGANTAITVNGLSTQSPGKTYAPMTVNAVAESNPIYTNGKIYMLSTTGEENNSLPQGLKAPVFIYPGAHHGQTDTVTVSLQLYVQDASAPGGWVTWQNAANHPLSLYYFDTTSNLTPSTFGSTGTAGVPNCTLNIIPTTASSVFSSCGYGLWADPSQSVGTVKLVATVASAHNPAYTYLVEPLIFTVLAQDSYARKVSFGNSSVTNSVWLAINPGAALAYVTPGMLATNVNSATGSYCGPSATPANSVACPSGSSCLWSGSVYSSHVAYQCFWDQGTLTNSSGATSGASLYAVGGGNTATHQISAYSYQTPTQYALTAGVPGAYNPSKPAQYSAGAYWSGAYIPRTGCTSTGGAWSCTVGNGANADLSFSPGVGATNILTKSEPAFQKYVASGSAEMDEYDVSIIAGANVKAAFVPTSSNILKGYNNSAYYCGAPGLETGQYLGNANASYDNYSSAAGLAALPKSNWSMATGISTTSFPPSASVGTTALAQSYYRLTTGGTGSSCSGTGSCSGGEVCGNDLTSANSGSQVLKCGNMVGWVTANQLNQLNASSNAIFFNTPTTGWSNVGVTVAQYQMCQGSTFTAYSSSAGLTAQQACGGVLWGEAQSGVSGTPTAAQQIVTPSVNLGYASSNWINYVFPTIKWLKQACPTCYSFPFDDPTSTFSCAVSNGPDYLEYQVNYGDLN